MTDHELYAAVSASYVTVAELREVIKDLTGDTVVTTVPIPNSPIGARFACGMAKTETAFATENPLAPFVTNWDEWKKAAEKDGMTVKDNPETKTILIVL